MLKTRFNRFAQVIETFFRHEPGKTDMAIESACICRALLDKKAAIRYLYNHECINAAGHAF